MYDVARRWGYSTGSGNIGAVEIWILTAIEMAIALLSDRTGIECDLSAAVSLNEPRFRLTDLNWKFSRSRKFRIACAVSTTESAERSDARIPIA